MTRRLSHCCCFSVRTGTITLAVLGILAGVSNVVSYSSLAANRGALHDVLNSFDLQFRQMREHGEIPEEELERLENYLTRIRLAIPYIVMAGIACSLLCITKCSLLLAGVLYGRSCLFMPYLVINLGGMIFYALAASCAIFLVFLYTSPLTGAVCVIISTLFFWLIFYLWHVVLSHYLEVKDEEVEQKDRTPLVVNEEAPPPFSGNDVLYKY